jgi:hypothetical protein
MWGAQISDLCLQVKIKSHHRLGRLQTYFFFFFFETHFILEYKPEAKPSRN